MTVTFFDPIKEFLNYVAPMICVSILFMVNVTKLLKRPGFVLDDNCKIKFRKQFYIVIQVAAKLSYETFIDENLRLLLEI